MNIHRKRTLQRLRDEETAAEKSTIRLALFSKGKVSHVIVRYTAST